MLLLINEVGNRRRPVVKTYKKPMHVRWKARLSALLCLVLIFGAVPGTVFADVGSFDEKGRDFV